MRGAIVVVLSDGWERGDVSLLDEQMRRLARLAHRVVWANPRKAREGFEPTAAALEYLAEVVLGRQRAPVGTKRGVGGVGPYRARGVEPP